MFSTVTIGNIEVVCRKGTYDQNIAVDVIRRECYKQLVITSKDIVLDAGANIGAFSLWVTEKCRRVIAVEPEPDNYWLMLRNLKSNGITNVTGIQGAIVGNNDETRPIYVNLKGNKAIHGVIPRKGRAEILATCYNINDIIREYKVTVMKVDVEGAEVEILEAITSTNWKKIKCLAVEYHFQALKDVDHKLYTKFTAMLSKHFPYVVYSSKINKRWTGIIYCYKRSPV